MSLTIGFARMLPRWAFPTLLGCAMPGALTAEAVAAAPECPGGQVAAAGRCVTVEEAATPIDAIVREAMATHDLKAVLAGFAIDGKPPSVAAWGESMTGVPATSDMHFRNGSVAIAYIGTVFLQLRDKGVLGVDDRLSKWFPEYPQADQITLTMLINGTSGYATLSPINHSVSFSMPIRSGIGVRTSWSRSALAGL